MIQLFYNEAKQGYDVYFNENLVDFIFVVSIDVSSGIEGWLTANLKAKVEIINQRPLIEAQCCGG